MSSKSIDIDLAGDGTAVVADMSQRTVMVIGVKGSGKSNTLGVMAGELSEQEGVRYLLIDPIGAYRTKELEGERETPALEAYLGPDEISGENGPAIADAYLNPKVVDERISFLLDLRHLSQSDKTAFVDGLCERLLIAKVNKADTVILIADEIHEFAPNKASRGEKLSAGHFVRLVTLGRNVGFGAVVASQRINKVHTDVRELADVFVFHKIIGTITLKNVKELLEYHTPDRETLIGILAEIQALKVGEVYIYDPSALNNGEEKDSTSVRGQVRSLDGEELGHGEEVESTGEGDEEPAEAEAEEEPIEGKAVGDPEDAQEAAEQEAVAQGLSPEDAAEVAEATLVAAEGRYTIVAKTPKAKALAKAAIEEDGKGDHDDPEFEQHIIASEPAAAQTHMTKHGRPGDKVYVDDDFHPEQMHPVAVHEYTEEHAMRKGLSQQDAHKVANAAEEAIAGPRLFQRGVRDAQRVAEKARREIGMGGPTPMPRRGMATGKARLTPTRLRLPPTRLRLTPLAGKARQPPKCPRCHRQTRWGNHGPYCQVHGDAVSPNGKASNRLRRTEARRPGTFRLNGKASSRLRLHGKAMAEPATDPYAGTENDAAAFARRFIENHRDMMVVLGKSQ